MHDLEKLTQEIITRGYPELEGKTITVSWADLTKDFEDAVLYYTELYPNPEEYEIALDERIQDASSDAALGYLAHELSHLVRFIAMSFYRRLIFVNLILELKGLPKNVELPNYLLTLANAYTRFDEKQTDTLMVKRGFGNELLSLLDFQKNNPVPNAPKNEGLTKKEVIKLMEKMERKQQKVTAKVFFDTPTTAIDTFVTPSSTESPAGQPAQQS